jgi:hypothetical protein
MRHAKYSTDSATIATSGRKKVTAFKRNGVGWTDRMRGKKV